MATDRRCVSSGVLVCLFMVGCAAAAAGCERCAGPDSAREVASPGDGPSAASPFDPDRPADPLAPPAERAPPNVWNTAEDYRMRALRLESCEVEPYFAPRPGHDKLGVLVQLEGRTEHEVPVNVLHASLEDASGHVYEPTPAGCRPTLAAGRVSRGEDAQGFISFEVPKGASGLILRYAPVIVGRSAEPLLFDLQR